MFAFEAKEKSVAKTRQLVTLIVLRHGRCLLIAHSSTLSTYMAQIHGWLHGFGPDMDLGQLWLIEVMGLANRNEELLAGLAPSIKVRDLGARLQAWPCR